MVKYVETLYTIYCTYVYPAQETTNSRESFRFSDDLKALTFSSNEIVRPGLRRNSITDGSRSGVMCRWRQPTKNLSVPEKVATVIGRNFHPLIHCVNIFYTVQFPDSNRKEESFSSVIHHGDAGCLALRDKTYCRYYRPHHSSFLASRRNRNQRSIENRTRPLLARCFSRPSP